MSQTAAIIVYYVISDALGLPCSCGGRSMGCQLSIDAESKWQSTCVMSGMRRERASQSDQIYGKSACKIARIDCPQAGKSMQNHDSDYFFWHTFSEDLGLALTFTRETKLAYFCQELRETGIQNIKA